MALNVAESVHIRLSREGVSIANNYYIEHALLLEVSQVRNLGVTIDSKLKFDIYVESLTCKAAKM